MSDFLILLVGLPVASHHRILLFHVLFLLKVFYSIVYKLQQNLKLLSGGKLNVNTAT